MGEFNNAYREKNNYKRTHKSIREVNEATGGWLNLTFLSRSIYHQKS